MHQPDLPGAAADPPGQRQLDQHLRRLRLPRQRHRHRRRVARRADARRGRPHRPGEHARRDPRHRHVQELLLGAGRDACSARRPQSRLLDQAAAAGRAARRRPHLRRARRPERQADRVLDQPPGAAGPGRVQHRRPTACSRRPTRTPAHATPNEAADALASRSRAARGAALPRCRRAHACAACAGAGAARRRRTAARRRATRRPSACRSPTPTSSCAPARAAAIRSSSSPRAASGSTIELRHTDWFRVRTDGGKVGWVQRGQLETTLTAAGEQQELPRRAARRLPEPQAPARRRLGPLQVGADAQGLDAATASPRRSASRRTLGQVQGVFSGTDFWHLNLIAEPWSDRRLSPFFGIGVGQFKNIPNQSLVGADDHQRQPRQRRRRRALLPHRPLRAARRLLALHRFRQRCEDAANTAPFTRRRLLLLLEPSDSQDTMTHKNTAHRLCPSRGRARRALAQAEPQPRPPPPTDQVVVPQVDRRDVQLPRYPVERLRDRRCSPAPTRPQNFGSSAVGGAAPRLPHHRGLLRRRRVRADQGQRRSRSARSCRAASSQRRRRSSATTTSRSATTCCRARCSSAASAARPSAAATSSAASAAPSSSTSAPDLQLRLRLPRLPGRLGRAAGRHARPHLLARPARQAPEHAEPRADRRPVRSSSDREPHR